MIGTTELILLSGLALLLFGGKKLPEMMHGLGQGVKEFKKGMKDGESDSKNDNHVEQTDEINLNQTLSDNKEHKKNAKQE